MCQPTTAFYYQYCTIIIKKLLFYEQTKKLAFMLNHARPSLSLRCIKDFST